MKERNVQTELSGQNANIWVSLGYFLDPTQDEFTQTWIAIAILCLRC